MSRLDSRQRRAILDAAVRVFAETGLAGATIRIVGRRAGVNSALIYYYFENKQNLFEEAIRMVIKDFLFFLDHRQKPFSGAGDRVAFLVNGVFDYYENSSDRMRLMMMAFNLHTQLLASIILEFARNKTALPLAVLQDGIRRKELKPFAPIQLWWNILGMCMFTMRAQEIAVRFREAGLPWQVPSMPERKRQIVELLLSGITVSQGKLPTKRNSLHARGMRKGQP